MAENPQKRPTKGILKNSSSFDKQQDAHSQPKKHKETTFDEMNILATLHPPGKDYGHMKINEPKTPYNYGDDDENEELDAAKLAERIRQSATKPPKFMLKVRPDSDGEDFGHDDDDDEDLTEEEKQRKKLFRMKRSKHYNEFQAVQAARQLIEEDECDDSDSDKISKSRSPTKSPSPCVEVDNSSTSSKSHNYQPGSSKSP